MNGGKAVSEMKEYEYHCDICMCPKEYWKPMQTYKGRCCELYSDFLGIIFGFENVRVFSRKDIIAKCNRMLRSEYKDIPDFGATINELMEIVIETGVMPTGYKSLEIV